jgi:LacI family transcriptional regulator
MTRKRNTGTPADAAESARRRPVTIRDIAAHTGFSKSLVALALKDDPRVAAATRQEIRKSAETLGYVTNPLVAHLMAELRQSRKKTFQANLALINCSPKKDIFEWHTFQDFRLGIQEGARHLGYGIDEFWLYEPRGSPARLNRIFRARQIPGIVFVAAAEPEIIHQAHNDLWRYFPAVAVGIEKTQPQIACVCADHYQTAKDAVDEVLKRGYQRPGFAISEHLDHLVDRRFSGGFLAAVMKLPASRQLPVHVADLLRPDAFAAWFKRHRPDCVLTVHDGVIEWLRRLEDRSARETGAVHLDWHEGVADCAGMIQSNRVVGRTAAEIVVQYIHTQMKGAPEQPHITLVESHWRDGPTLPARTG